MDSMVEENGGNSSIDPLSVGPTGNGTDNHSGGPSGGGQHVEGANVNESRQQQQQQQPQHQHHQTNNSEFPANILTAQSPGLTVLKSSPGNVVHLITHPSQSSVIQSSVIQSANNVQQIINTSKGASGAPPPSSHTVYVSNKSSSVIQAPSIRIKSEPYSSSSMQAVDTSDEDDSCSDEDAASRKRRDMLTRRPSYHKILKEISGPDMSVIPTTTLHLAGPGSVDGTGGPGMHGQGGGGQVQYISGQEFYVPAVLSGPVVPEDQSRKREIRLQKNREAARECRRKKKEYIKCLENRVAVLENQNKALIEELKSLKELYCMTKTE